MNPPIEKPNIGESPSKLFQRVKKNKLEAIKRRIDHPELKVKWLLRDGKAPKELVQKVAGNRAVVKRLQEVLATPFAARKKGEQQRFLSRTLPKAKADLKQALADAKRAIVEVRKADTLVRQAMIKLEWTKFIGHMVSPPTNQQIRAKLETAMRNVELQLELRVAAKNRMKILKHYGQRDAEKLIDKDEPKANKLFKTAE